MNGRHVVCRLRLRRRAYEPTSNTASHDNHEKSKSWVSFSFPWWVWSSAWRPFGQPEFRYKFWYKKHSISTRTGCSYKDYVITRENNKPENTKLLIMIKYILNSNRNQALSGSRKQGHGGKTVLVGAQWRHREWSSLSAAALHAGKKYHILKSLIFII